MNSSDGIVYWGGFWLTWIVVFLGSWAYCTFTYGFLLGFGLGWLPSSILATILAFLWPVLLIGGLLLWLYLSKH